MITDRKAAVKCVARFLLLLTSCSAAFGTAGTPELLKGKRADCKSSNGLNFICGPVGSEDMVRIPNTPYIIASGLGLGKPGQLYLLDTRNRQVRSAFPVDTVSQTKPSTTGCPGAPDTSRGSYSGLGLRQDKDGAIHIYAVNNHRKAIEFFRFHRKTRDLVWEDCAVMPAGTAPNGLAPLSDGGLLVTSFRNTTDPDSWARMERGEPTGAVYEWHPGTGFAIARGLDSISGANGLEVSADGKTTYVSAWATREILIQSRNDGNIRKISLDFMPDNIRRLKDGSLLIAGQRTTVESIAKCRADCPQPWVVIRIDPMKGKIEKLLEGPGNALVNYACSAIIVNDVLYVTARGDNRLIYVPLKRS